MAPNSSCIEKDPVVIFKRTPRFGDSKANGFGPPLYTGRDEFEAQPLWGTMSTYFGYALLILVGYCRDLLRHLGFGPQIAKEQGNEEFVPLYSDFESFYTRHLYRRIRDCWNRPVSGEPKNQITLFDRVTNDHNWTLKQSGTTTTVLNLASYNYLGFSSGHECCAKFAIKMLQKYGAATCSPDIEMGTYTLLKHCEKLVAEMVGQEAALVLGMGFATNCTVIPALVDTQCLILSDALNHSSIVLGIKLSGAHVKIFKHNDMKHLEYLLRRAVIEGQPRTQRPYKKVLILAEGLYSMEGTTSPLRELVRLKKKYKAYLYIDEAHSIGAMGNTGRGVCEYWGVNPKDVDVMMGTFSKSFGSAGGYVASSKHVIQSLRTRCYARVYATSMAPPVTAHVVGTINIINSVWEPGNGVRRLAKIRDNTRYFRRKLIEMGFIIYGMDDSPVVPLLIFQPAKLAAFSREMLARGAGVVVVGYPAVPITTGRARFCMSAAHTREDLVRALAAIDEVGDILGLKLSRQPYAKGFFEP